jgi:cytidine deaminase
MAQDIAKTVLTQLFDLGSRAKDNAYAPYSNHPVGAALMSDKGAFFAGGNAETANYKGTCAEAGAIAAMITAGERKIEAIAVVGPGEHLCSPCGDCRQRIREFASDLDTTRVFVFNQTGGLLKSYSVDQLLPDSFGPANVAALKPPTV